MRPVNEIIVHCTATPEGRHTTVSEIDTWHRARGWSGIGYHFVVYLDGTVHDGRPIDRIGAHVSGHNTGTIGVVYVGGVAKDGKTAKDTRTPQQKLALTNLLISLRDQYGIRKVSGHNEYAAKACPSFDASAEYDYLFDGTTKAGFVPIVDQVLRRGDSGPEVAAWRDKLRLAGYDVPRGDVFDQFAETVTRWFQAKRNIAVDGTVGPQTRDEMNRYLESVAPYEVALPDVVSKEPDPAPVDVQAVKKHLQDALALLG